MRIGFVVLAILVASCNTVKVEDGSSGNSENTCAATVSRIIADRKDFFDVDDGLTIDLSELSQKEKDCMPKVSGYFSGIETALKLYEAGGEVGDSELLAVASVETYLKYLEAVGGTPSEDPIMFASVETYLKYAEAAGLTNGGTAPAERLAIASVETYLKAAEAGGVNRADSAIASVETYLKFWEAMGDTIDYEQLKITGSPASLLKAAEALEFNPYLFYSSSIAYSLTGMWSLALDSKGLVSDGSRLWTSKSTLASNFNVESLYDDVATGVLADKGVVTSAVKTSDIKYLADLNKSGTAEQLERILDKGAVVDRSLLEYLSDLNLTTDESVDRLLDKGIVIETPKNGIKGISILLKAGLDTDTGLDKGLMATGNSLNLIQGILESNLVTPEQVLDKGYHIQVYDNTIIIMSVESYLMVFEALRGPPA